MPNGHKILSGWKEIAEFLGVEARTAQGYKEEGIPVAKIKNRVFTTTAALLGWVDSLLSRHNTWIERPA